MSCRGFSCAERFLTRWNYFPIGFKGQTLIVLLQHKLEDMEGVSKATVHSANKYRRISRASALQINLRFHQVKLQKETSFKQLQSILGEQHFKHSRQVQGSVISVRWLSVG